MLELMAVFMDVSVEMLFVGDTELSSPSLASLLSLQAKFKYSISILSASQRLLLPLPSSLLCGPLSPLLQLLKELSAKNVRVPLLGVEA